MEIHGHCDESFAALRDEFERNFTERGDVGASFAATVEGEYVVDLWAGHRDAAKSLPWEEDTIVCVYSVTKTMTTLATLLLVDRGELDYDEPVTKYWPEFGQNGKESVLVRHIMGHTAGLPGFEESLSHAQLYDWDHVVGLLERQAPVWEPGTTCGYHALTHGFLVGEIVRRITGLSIGTFVRDEIGVPLDVDFHIGLGSSHLQRTADLIASGPLPPELQKYMRQRQGSLPSVRPPATNSEGFRRAEVPAINGHGNARSVVRAQTFVANGGSAFGTHLLSPSTIEQIFREQGVVKGMRVRHGIGYGLSGMFTKQMPEDVKSCFWAGGGGSTVILDLSNRVCMSYVMNQMEMNLLGDKRGARLTQAFYAGLG